MPSPLDFIALSLAIIQGILLSQGTETWHFPQPYQDYIFLLLYRENQNILFYFHIRSYSSILLAPDSVNLYFCRRLLGLSGMVISIKPSSKSGSMCRLNERESPFSPIVAKISLRESVLFLSIFSTDICLSVNST